MTSSSKSLNKADGVADLIGTLFKYKDLLFELSSRELKDKYINHSLGGAWAFMSPLLMSGLYIYLFSEVFPTRLGGTFEGPKSLIWLLSGITVWFMVSDLLGRSLTAITSAPSLVKQVVFPVEILPAQVVLTAIPTFAVGMMVVLGLVAWVDPNIFIGTVWMLPLALILFAIISMGLTYLLAAFAPFMQDLREIMAFVAGAGMFLAPVLYFPPTIENLNPVLKGVLEGNPFTHLLACFRDAVFYGQMTQPLSWGITAVFALVLAFFGFSMFQRLKPHFSEAI